MAFLSVEDVHLAFGDRTVLNGLSFNIAEGEVYSLIGPNGAGKSTTINVICDILRPLRGTVVVGGRSNTEISRATLGVAPQEVAVYRDLTCSQNLEFFGAVYGLSSKQRRTRAASCLDAVGLSDRAGSMVSELSGGMQRRLHLAAALLHEPELLILDEPTVGLDLEVRQRIWNLISDLKRAGRAILITTHQLEEAELLGTRVGIVHDGLIAAQGTMDDLRRLLPAAELAVVESDQPDAVWGRARELGLEFRTRHDSTVLWLEKRLDIRGVADLLGGVPLTSIRMKAVGLEEIFSEVVGTASPFDHCSDPKPH